jgi:hypothetical protein
LGTSTTDEEVLRVTLTDDELIAAVEGKSDDDLAGDPDYDPALTGRKLRREPADPVLLLGNSIIVIARPWQFGERSGLTAERVFIRVDGYYDSEQLEQSIERFFPDVKSEELARMLDNGVLKQIDSLPLPISLPTSD